MDIALGNYLRLQNQKGTSSFYFQNFFIQSTSTFQGDEYTFVPYGFSGVTVNRSGDNTEATLVFPNNELTRAWALNAVQQRWLARVYVMALDAEDTSKTRLTLKQINSMRLASEAHDAQQKEEAVFVQKMYGQPAQDDNLEL